MLVKLVEHIERKSFMSKQPFLPIIVGTDINAYNMAISFHEEYNIRPILVGKGVLPFTNLSTIPRAIEYDKKLGEPDQFAKILISVAKNMVMMQISLY